MTINTYNKNWRICLNVLNLGHFPSREITFSSYNKKEHKNKT